MRGTLTDLQPRCGFFGKKNMAVERVWTEPQVIQMDFELTVRYAGPTPLLILPDLMGMTKVHDWNAVNQWNPFTVALGRVSESELNQHELHVHH